MKHLLIVDGHHLMYRAYFGLPRTMKTSKGELVNAIFGVGSMLLTMLKTEQPDAIIFCFDEGEETFRHTEYKEYKTGRAETPQEFYDQIPRIIGLVDAFGFRHVSDGKYEADDFACCYAKAAEKEGFSVTVVSGDRDLFQLASDHIRIVIPHKAYQAAEYLGPAEILAKYGVTPAQIPSYKGLVGDASDHLKGVLGIGPKAASALLQEFGTLKNLYENLDTVKPGWKAKLEAGRDQAFFCERMAQLVCDISPFIPLEELLIKDVDSMAVIDFFHSIESAMLARRVTAMLETPYGKEHFRAVNAHQQAKSAPTQERQSQLSLL